MKLDGFIKGAIIGAFAIGAGMLLSPYLGWVPGGSAGAQIAVTSIGYVAATELKLA